MDTSSLPRGTLDSFTGDHFPPYYTNRGAFNTPPPVHPTYSPFRPRFHLHRRISHCSCHPNQLRIQRLQWHSYRYARSAESLRSEYGRTQAENGWRWRYPDFTRRPDAESHDARRQPSRPVSPLGRVDGDGPGYAETVVESDGGVGEREDANPCPRERGLRHGTVCLSGTSGQAEIPRGRHSPAFPLSGSNWAPYPPPIAAAQQVVDDVLHARWKALLARESRLAAREAAVEEERENYESERGRLARGWEEVRWKLENLEIREHELRQFQSQLQRYQHWFRRGRETWRVWVGQQQNMRLRQREEELAENENENENVVIKVEMGVLISD